MIEEESGKTTRLEVPAGLHVEDEPDKGLQEEQEETMATQEEAVTMVTSEDSSVYTTTVVATGDKHHHGDGICTETEKGPEEQKLMEITQPMVTSYVVVRVRSHAAKATSFSLYFVAIVPCILALGDYH